MGHEIKVLDDPFTAAQLSDAFFPPLYSCRPAARQGSLALAYTSIRHALGQLEGCKAVEQDGNGGWRIASEANS
jgi:hypothetical protein